MRDVLKIEIDRILQLIEDGDLEQAIVATELLVEFSPGYVSIASEVFPALDKAGKQAEVDRMFAKVSAHFLDILKNYPEFSRYLNNFAWACVKCNRNTEQAHFLSEQAVKLRPNNSSYLDTLAELSFQIGDAQRASELSERCVEINPTKRHYREQLERFKKAAAVSPGTAQQVN